MGHSGAFTIPGEPDAREKIAALEAAGATIINHPEKFGEALQSRLQSRAGNRGPSSLLRPGGGQRREFHSASRRVVVDSRSSSAVLARGQRRSIYLSEDRAFDLLRERGVNAAPYSGRGTRRFLAIGIDRSARSPCIIASPSADPEAVHALAKRFPFDYMAGADGLRANRIAEHLKLGHGAASSLSQLIQKLARLFYEKEAFLLETQVVERLGEVKVVGARFGFDDAAYRSLKRQGDIQAMRDVSREDPWEIEAERAGIVYIKLAGDGRIGTLVNGAGLAMNTVDALRDAGGRAANFLDTGGLATSETVRKSFEVILQDPRVRVIFVNIFGGLTLGDMIARGILLAFGEIEMKIPVVVRIRGTREEEGQKIIAESGLPLHAFDDFQEAAAKAIELSRV